MILPHTFTRVQPAEGTDTRNDPALDYGDAATRIADVPGWFQQTNATETITARDELVTRFTLFSDATPDMTATERVEWSGRTFKVDGEPNHLENPSGYHHSEIQLLEVQG